MPRDAMGSSLQMQSQVAHDQSYDAQEFFNSLVNARSGQAQNNSIDLIDFADRGDDNVTRNSCSLEASCHSSTENEEAIAGMVRNGVLIPPLTDNFWSVYGNKLRIFGTYEKVMDINQVARETGNTNWERL